MFLSLSYVASKSQLNWLYEKSPITGTVAKSQKITGAPKIVSGCAWYKVALLLAKASIISN